jgi:hypothetical protein
MRLGKKKEKDRDTEKEQLIDGVARLICSPKHNLVPLRGNLIIKSTAQNKFKFTLFILFLNTQFTSMEPNGRALNSFNYHRNGRRM